MLRQGETPHGVTADRPDILHALEARSVVETARGHGLVVRPGGARPTPKLDLGRCRPRLAVLGRLRGPEADDTPRVERPTGRLAVVGGFPAGDLEGRRSGPLGRELDLNGNGLGVVFRKKKSSLEVHRGHDRRAAAHHLRIR